MGILMLYDMVDFKVARFIEEAPTCGNTRMVLKNLHMDSLNIGNSFSTGRTISNNFGLVLGLTLQKVDFKLLFLNIEIIMVIESYVVVFLENFIEFHAFTSVVFLGYVLIGETSYWLMWK